METNRLQKRRWHKSKSKSGSVEEKEKPIFHADLALFDLINSIDDTEILGLNTKLQKVMILIILKLTDTLMKHFLQKTTLQLL